MKARILVTDGTHKNALSLIRDLGNEFDIDVLSHKPKWRTLCASSKHVKETLEVPSPEDLGPYSDRILEILATGDYDFFIPVGLQSYLASARKRDEIARLSRCLLPSVEGMRIAANKDLTMTFARDIGIPIPKTVVLKDASDLNLVPDFPVVIKSSDSAGRCVRYCNNRQELEDNFSKLLRTSKTRVIAQEYVQGFGCGFYGIYKNGVLLDFFLHRRLIEFPLTGGPSAVAESYFDQGLFENGKKLADALRWNGPIMVEFKKNPKSGRIFLIEVNPKLWGSLDLTIEAGIDVPRIILNASKSDGSLERDLGIQDAHFTQLRYRWLFPDEFKAAMSRKKMRPILELMRKGAGKEKNNLIFNDPLPTIMQLFTGLFEGAQVAINDDMRYPNGVSQDAVI
jgi:predicted ATP-grasp superfamily ATP-dependent carboligase